MPRTAPSTKSVSLSDVVRCADAWLQPGRFKDYEGAFNGLQVENLGGVSKIVACVDATPATVDRAIAGGGNLMIVHHGLFWGKTTPWTGNCYRLIRRLIESDMAVYSQHLPLDAHPTLGNAAQLARAMGMKSLKPFFFEDQQSIGWRGRWRGDRAGLSEKLALILGRPPVLLPGGTAEVREVGICTGGAGSHLGKAAAEGVDTFITGEGPHWTFAAAEDRGINVFYGGHYATETFGVMALAAELSRHFRIPWEFVDHPTGL